MQSSDIRGIDLTAHRCLSLTLHFSKMPTKSSPTVREECRGIHIQLPLFHERFFENASVGMLKPLKEPSAYSTYEFVLFSAA